MVSWTQYVHNVYSYVPSVTLDGSSIHLLTVTSHTLLPQPTSRLTSISYLARTTFPASPEPLTLRFHCASSCCNTPHTSSYLFYSSGTLMSFAFQFNSIVLYGLLRNLSRNGHNRTGLKLNPSPAFQSHEDKSDCCTGRHQESGNSTPFCRPNF